MFGQSYKVNILTDRYQDGNLAVRAESGGEQFATISVNLPESNSLPRDAFYAKHWSENETFPEQLVAQGVIKPYPAPVASSGFVSGIRAYQLVETKPN